jgi:hypothetical protein
MERQSQRECMSVRGDDAQVSRSVVDAKLLED